MIEIILISCGILWGVYLIGCYVKDYVEHIGNKRQAEVLDADNSCAYLEMFERSPRLAGTIRPIRYAPIWPEQSKIREFHRNRMKYRIKKRTIVRKA